MSNSASIIPLSYSTPTFPSLYWPISAPPGAAKYLYSTTAIWRFTLYWTLITFSIVHTATAAWAVLMQLRSAVVLHRRQHSEWKRGGTGGAQGHSGGGDHERYDNGNDNNDYSASSIRPSTGTSSAAAAAATKSAPMGPLLTLKSPIMSTLGWVWVIPLVYISVGLLEALLSGSLVGLLAGAVYNAGNFKMSTWMPFLWGMINCLVVILGSFRLQGGL